MSIKKKKEKTLTIDMYPYLPVEAETRAPLYNRICTHSGRLWRAAKCKGVAPLPSLIFTNRANPLQSIQFIFFFMFFYKNQHKKSPHESISGENLCKNRKKDQPRSSHWTRLSGRKNCLKTRRMTIISCIVQAGSSVTSIKH